MSGCRFVQSCLPEYAADRRLPHRDQIERHLTCCEECARVLHEMQAVIALLSGPAEPPATEHTEANTRLALRSLMAPGPCRANAEASRRETALLALWGLVSLAAGGAATAGVWERRRLLDFSLWTSRWAVHGLALAQGLAGWWPALLLVAAATAVLAPAVALTLRHTPRRRLEREA